MDLTVELELATSGGWSGVGDFRRLEWSWRLRAVGVELAISGGWSGVGDFGQLEWSWRLQAVGVELTVGMELTVEWI